MARELSRIQQGYFKTPDRIVTAIARHLQPVVKDGIITVLDAGCGEGLALLKLKQSLGGEITTLGIESDKNRADIAAEVLDEVLWSSIEDTKLVGHPSLLWFNPPYDSIRGEGRMEKELLSRVIDWPAKRTGLIVVIVPDYVIYDRYNSFFTSIINRYETLGLWRFPSPEYDVFKQCVYIGRRRECKPAGNSGVINELQNHSDNWPELPDIPKGVFTIASGKPVSLQRQNLTTAVIQETIARSELQSVLLRETLSPDPPFKRPPLSLKAGHLALALAGGLCDGIIEKDGIRFLLKGMLSRRTLLKETRDKLDENGRICAKVDIYRTVYSMDIKCLRNDGTVEVYASTEKGSEDEK